MAFKLLPASVARALHNPPRQNPNLLISPPSPYHHLRRRFITPPPNLCLTASTTTIHRNGFAAARVVGGPELAEEDEGMASERKELAEQSIWDQMKETVMFTGPATGLWLCGPLMSLIDTAVIGQGSSIELAALAILGSLLGIVGTSVPWLFPYIFTPDQMVIQEMHTVLIPYLVARAVTPPTHSLEGTLMILSSRFGLQGCWLALAGFQWARFSMALQRLLSPNGILYSEDLDQYKQQKLSTA